MTDEYSLLLECRHILTAFDVPEIRNLAQLYWSGTPAYAQCPYCGEESRILQITRVNNQHLFTDHHGVN